jgi:hypothetical protein
MEQRVAARKRVAAPPEDIQPAAAGDEELELRVEAVVGAFQVVLPPAVLVDLVEDDDRAGRVVPIDGLEEVGSRSRRARSGRMSQLQCTRLAWPPAIARARVVLPAWRGPAMKTMDLPSASSRQTAAYDGRAIMATIVVRGEK